MKREYKTPLTEIVYLSIGELLQDGGDLTQDSTGETTIFNSNNSTFEEEETTNFQGGRNLWED